MSGCSIGQLSETGSVLFDDLDFQIVKVDLLNKAVLRKPGSGVTLKIRNRAVQPDGIFQIELVTDLLQAPENFVGSGVLRIVAYYGVFEQSIVFPYFSP